MVLEAQQIAMDERPDHSFYNLSIDAGSMWSRRLIEGLIAREHAPPGAQSAVIPIHPVA